MPKAEPLSSVDAAWLGMEDPTNLMMVSGIVTFEKPIDYERLRTVLARRFLVFNRFRQRVVQPRLPFGMPYWEFDPNFNLDNHLHRIALPAPGDKEMLQEVVGDLMSTPLDFSKPLWHMHVIENYDGGAAVMTRLHHSIADGMALVFVLLSMTDFSPDAPLPPEPDFSGTQDGPDGALGALLEQASSLVKSAREVTGRVVSESLETMINPAHGLELALQGTDHAVAASRLVLRTPDPKTIFKGPLGVQKRASWSRPLPLKEVKTIKNVMKGTVNDVLVSAITGALRRYLVGRDQDTAGLNFRAAVPVNIRKADEMADMGNKFGLVFLSLPVGIADPLERLAEVRQRMTALKNSPEAIAAFGILGAIGMNPRAVQQQLVDMFGAKTTCVLTNVPGPPMPLYLAGNKITGLMFWVPQSGRVGLGISILSYAGKVFVGVATDAGLVPDPDSIIENFYEEYDALLDLVRQAEAVAAEEAAPVEPESSPATGAAEVSDTAVAAEPEPQRCQGITKSGSQCKRQAQAGSDYCWTHQPDES